VRTLIDTNIAIHLRDGDARIAARLAELPAHPAISVLTRVELEGGVYRNPDETPALRERVDLMLSQFPELPFTSEEAIAYGRIVERCGFSRPRIIDRMIAATAIVADATLITINAADFREIAGLKLESWDAGPG
jgi:predicted nucleic acid-binding protein